MPRYTWPNQNGYRGSGKLASRKTRYGWKTVEPESLAVRPYLTTFMTNTFVSGNRDYGVNEMGCLGEEYTQTNVLLNQARMRAYAKFKDKAYASASLGVSLAELGESVGMFNNRAVQLYRGVRALRKGDFREFLRLYNLEPLPKHRKLKRNRPKDAAGLWLEYWLGWAPMVGDIYSAIEVLTSEMPKTEITASATTRGPTRTHEWGRTDNAGEGGGWSVSTSARVRYQATLRITNPNLFLMNQLGLINPAAVFFELVPFSFIFNWFHNLSDVLSQWSDWLGLELVDPFTGSKTTVTGTEWRKPQWTMIRSQFKVQQVVFDRSLGFTLPTLGWRKFDRLSVTRGATAISLLLALFTKDLRPA